MRTGSEPLNSVPSGADYYGIKIREYFAAMAMQGLMATPDKGCDVDIATAEAAKISVKMADALIEELNK